MRMYSKKIILLLAALVLTVSLVLPAHARKSSGPSVQQVPNLLTIECTLTMVDILQERGPVPVRRTRNGAYKRDEGVNTECDKYEYYGTPNQRLLQDNFFAFYLYEINTALQKKAFTDLLGAIIDGWKVTYPGVQVLVYTIFKDYQV